MTLRGALCVALTYPVTAPIPFFQHAIPGLGQKRCGFLVQSSKALNKKVMVVAIGHWTAAVIWTEHAIAAVFGPAVKTAYRECRDV